MLNLDTDSGIAAGGYKINVPTEALENRGIDDRDLQSFSSGGQAIHLLLNNKFLKVHLWRVI